MAKVTCRDGVDFVKIEGSGILDYKIHYQLAPFVGKTSQIASTKFDIEKFSSRNDFGLWRLKMRVILVQQGLVDTLKGESGLPETLSKKEKADLYSAIILCLSDKVLREVCREKLVAAIWLKLESLYMTKSMAHRLYMKQRLYSFKIQEEKVLSDQLDEYIKILDDLKNIEVKITNEDKALILLNALPKSFEHFRDALLYGKEQTITLEEIQSALQAKELQRKHDAKE